MKMLLRHIHAANTALLASAVSRRPAASTPMFAPDLGWSALAKGPIEVLENSGDHCSLLEEPQVHLLAAQLRQRFAT